MAQNQEIYNEQRLGNQPGFAYTPTDQQLALKVLTKFQTMDIYTYQPVEEDVLYSAIDLMTNSSFDREIARQIYEQCSPDFKGRIFIEDFVRVSFDAKKILTEKLRKSKLELDERTKEKQALLALKQQNTGERIYNQFGIDSNSVLKVDVIEAGDLSNSGNQSELPYVILKCSQTQQQTTVPFVKDRVNPKWNQFFEFPIQMGSEELHIEILSYDQIENVNFLIGQVSVPVNTLKDQMKVDKWYSIKDSVQNIVKGRIRLSLHWLFDKAKYYEGMLNNLVDHINNIDADIIDFNDDITQIDSYLNAKELPPEALQHKIQVSHRQLVKTMIQEAQTPPYLKLTIYLTLALLLSSIFQSFARPPFFDLVIGMFILIGFFINFFERIQYQLTLALLLFSILQDIVWLGFFLGDWWLYQGEEDLYPQEAHPLLRFSIVFVFFSLVIKVGKMYLDSKIYFSFKVFLGINLSQSLDLFLSMNQSCNYNFGEYQFITKSKNEIPRFHPNENPFFDHINNYGKLQDTTYLKGKLNVTQVQNQINSHHPPPPPK